MKKAILQPKTPRVTGAATPTEGSIPESRRMAYHQDNTGNPLPFVTNSVRQQADADAALQAIEVHFYGPLCLFLLALLSVVAAGDHPVGMPVAVVLCLAAGVWAGGVTVWDAVRAGGVR